MACQLVPRTRLLTTWKSCWSDKREALLADANRLLRRNRLGICSRGNLLPGKSTPGGNLLPEDLLGGRVLEAEDLADANGLALISQGEAAELRAVLELFAADGLLHLDRARDDGSRLNEHGRPF